MSPGMTRTSARHTTGRCWEEPLAHSTAANWPTVGQQIHKPALTETQASTRCRRAEHRACSTRLHIDPFCCPWRRAQAWTRVARQKEMAKCWHKQQALAQPQHPEQGRCTRCLQAPTRTPSTGRTVAVRPQNEYLHLKPAPQKSPRSSKPRARTQIPWPARRAGADGSTLASEVTDTSHASPCSWGGNTVSTPRERKPGHKNAK